MKKQNITVLVLLFIFVLGLLSLWQYSIYQKLSKIDMSCGGDWSYNARCPIGSYCQSLGQGPLGGGICKPLTSPIFDIFINHESEKTEGSKSNSCFCDLDAVTLNNCFPFTKPVCTTKFDCECKLFLPTESSPAPQTLLMYTTENDKYSFLYKGDLQVTEEESEYYENLISIKKDKKYINSIVFYPPKDNSKLDNLEEDIKEGRGIFDTVGLESKHITIAGQSALLFNKNPEGGPGPVAYVKLEGRYIEFVGLGNESIFNTIINSFKLINQK